MVRVIGTVDPDNGLGVNTVEGLHLRGLQGGNCALLFARCNRNNHAYSYDLARVTAHFALPLIEAANLESVLYPEEGTYFEGTEKLVQHKLRERSPKLVRDAKHRFQQKHGRLFCEVCAFDFSEHYVNGNGFVEAHHLVPVSQMQPGQQVRITDLAMVCSNCHRMLHIHPHALDRGGMKSILNQYLPNHSQLSTRKLTTWRLCYEHKQSTNVAQSNSADS